MTERVDTIEGIERVLRLTHKESITVTIPRLTAERAVSMLKKQPEIIMCEDCKYWRQLYGDRSEVGCCDCDDMWRSLGGEITEVESIRTDSDFYCGYADRK